MTSAYGWLRRAFGPKSDPVYTLPTLSGETECEASLKDISLNRRVLIQRIDESSECMLTLIEEADKLLANVTTAEYYEDPALVELGRLVDRIAKTRYELIELRRKLVTDEPH